MDPCDVLLSQPTQTTIMQATLRLSCHTLFATKKPHLKEGMGMPPARAKTNATRKTSTPRTQHNIHTRHTSHRGYIEDERELDQILGLATSEPEYCRACPAHVPRRRRAAVDDISAQSWSPQVPEHLASYGIIGGCTERGRYPRRHLFRPCQKRWCCVRLN